jgi:hypothetical protein
MENLYPSHRSSFACARGERWTVLQRGTLSQSGLRRGGIKLVYVEPLNPPFCYPALQMAKESLSH